MIPADRSKYVELTQPIAKSVLSMIVSVKLEEAQKAWMFTKPFTLEIWAANCGIFIYPMIVVGYQSAALICNLVVHLFISSGQPFGSSSPSLLFSSLTVSLILEI